MNYNNDPYDINNVLNEEMSQVNITVLFISYYCH